MRLVHVGLWTAAARQASQKCRKKAVSVRYLRTELTDGGIKELNRR
jgi:hypothetical protein